MERTDLMWQRLAEPYGEHFGQDNVLQAFLVIPAFLRLVGDIAGKRILDLGCGLGGLSLTLADAAMMVQGIDISSNMIDLASKNARRMGIANAQFLTLDCCELDTLDTSSFDIVVSAAMFHYIEDIDRAFLDVSRLLRNRGVFVFSTLHPFTTAYEPRLGIDTGPYEEFDDVNYFDDTKRLTLPPWEHTTPAENPGSIPSVEVFHHPLQYYHASLRTAGFAIDAIDEMKPTPELERADSALYERLWKDPIFITFKAIRN
jgi:SAM-dependent methyltransferase